jgi:hypothetical protein
MALLYHLKGLVLGRAAQVVESEQAFDAVQSIHMKWDAPALNQWRMMLKLLPTAKMKLADRERLLQKYQSQGPRYSKDSSVAINALAIGWYRTKDSARYQDFMVRGFPKALAILKPGYESGDPAAMMNAIALLDERLFGSAGSEGLLQALSPDFFLPFSQQAESNPWKGGNETPRNRLSPEVRKLLKPISDTAETMGKLFADCAKRVRLDPKRATEVRLRILACDTILALAGGGNDALSRRALLASRAAELKAQASDVPSVLNAYAYFMICSGNFVEAGRALRRSYELDPNDEKVKKLNSIVSAMPVFIQPRPAKSGWFGSRPLVRVTLLAPESPGGMASGEMSFDGQKVEALIIGSQLVFLVPEGRLTDGKHVVKASALDGYGNKAEIEFEFGVDKVAPKVVIEPAPGGELAGPQPAWTIKLSDDGAGVDVASVQVRLNNVGSGSTPCRAVLVDNGAFQIDMPATGGKRGERIPGDTFKVSSFLNLTAGQYELTVTFADQAGNRKTQSWTYQVK